MRADERDARFMFADGGFALAFEGAIENRELPARGRLARPDSVLAVEEMQIVSDVAAVMNSRERGTEVKIDVRDIAMLRVTRANGDRAGIAVLNFEVHVAERGIKCARAGVRGRERRAVFCGTSPREENHVFGTLLKTFCVGAKDEHGTRLAKTENANAGPNVDGASDAIAAGGQKHNTLVDG